MTKDLKEMQSLVMADLARRQQKKLKKQLGKKGISERMSRVRRGEKLSTD